MSLSAFIFRAGAIAAAACAAACATISTPAPREADSYANFLVARLANLRGDHQAASDRYIHALANQPHDPALIEGALAASLASGDIDRARELSRVSLPQEETPSYARLVRAADAINGGRWRHAREQLDLVEGNAAEELTARILLTWARTAEGHVEDTRVELERLAAMRPYGALFAYQHALALDYSGDGADALTNYAQAASGGLWMPPAVLRHASLLHRAGRRDEAIALLRAGASNPNAESLARALARMEAGDAPVENALTPSRGAAMGLFGLGAIYLQENDSNRGLITLSLALMLDPQLDAARLMYAETQSELDHVADARAALDRIPSESPYAESARVMSAWVLMREGRKDEAVALAQQNAQTGTVRSQRALADIYRSVDRYADAEPIYSHLIENGGADWRLYFARGAAREKLNRWDEAEADLRHALELSPDQPDVLNFLGYMWVDRGEHLHEGLAMIQRAVEIRPLSGAVIDSLGWAYYRLGDYDKALDYLERAVELEPADATLNDHLGDLYWRLDRRTEARFQWRRAISLDPDSAQAIEAKLERGLAPTLSATR